MRPQITSWSSERCVIPLERAWYCESCRAICNDATCCNCSSAEHTHGLAAWLEREPAIKIPATGVFLTVIPAAKKRPQKVECTPPQALPRAS